MYHILVKFEQNHGPNYTKCWAFWQKTGFLQQFLMNMMKRWQLGTILKEGFFFFFFFFFLVNNSMMLNYKSKDFHLSLFQKLR